MPGANAISARVWSGYLGGEERGARVSVRGDTAFETWRRFFEGRFTT